jgi:hypothetical protein
METIEAPDTYADELRERVGALSFYKIAPLVFAYANRQVQRN